MGFKTNPLARQLGSQTHALQAPQLGPSELPLHLLAALSLRNKSAAYQNSFLSGQPEHLRSPTSAGLDPRRDKCQKTQTRDLRGPEIKWEKQEKQQKKERKEKEKSICRSKGRGTGVREGELLAETPCRDWALLSVCTGQTVQEERKGRGVWIVCTR